MRMSNLLRRRIEWVLWNGMTVTCAVWGLVFGSHMATNAFKFLVWIQFVMALCACSSDVRMALRQKGPSMPWRLTLFIDLSVAVLLAAYGWFGYATIVAVGGFCGVAAYVEGEGEKDQVGSHG